MGLSIQGIGVVSALGPGVASFRAGLEGGQRPQVSEFVAQTPEGRVSLPVYEARIEGLERFVSARTARRFDRFVRMAALSAHLAIEDAGPDFQRIDRTRVGLVFGAGYGPQRTTFQFQDGLIDEGDKCASPTLFANSVHNAAASTVSILLQVEGPCQTVTAFHQTTSGALLTAQAWLDSGAIDWVLAGVGEEFSPTLGYAIACQRGETGGGIEPLRFSRCSYAPGEGFVTFALSHGGGGAKYGTFESVACGEPVNGRVSGEMAGLAAVVLSANGDARAGGTYRDALAPGTRVAAYSPMYGSMPVGAGFDLAVAAFSLRDRKICPTPAPETDADLKPVVSALPLPPGSRLGCLECGPDGTCNLVVASGPDSEETAVANESPMKNDSRNGFV